MAKRKKRAPHKIIVIIFGTNSMKTFSAIFVRKSLSINGAPWKNTPWSTHPKKPKDTLTDILHEIALLLEGLDEVRASSGTSEKAQQLLLDASRTKHNLDAWSLSVSASNKSFIRLTNSTIEPPEVRSTLDISLLYLTNMYYCACMLLETTIGFLHLAIDSQKGQSVLDEETHISEKRLNSSSGNNTDNEQDSIAVSAYELQELAILKASKVYAYKVAHSSHLLRGSNVGIYMYSESIQPIALACSLLTALEPAREASPERQRLEYLFTSHALFEWVSQFAEATENREDDLEEAKSRRFRWWTKGLNS